MVNSIGYGEPGGPADFRWPEESVVLEALAATIRPEQIDAVVAATNRKKRRIRRLPLVVKHEDANIILNFGSSDPRLFPAAVQEPPRA